MNGFLIAIIISVIIIITLTILGTRLDNKIIEEFYNTDFSNNFQILENNNGQQFNLIDSTIDFFTPKIFRPSSYRGTNENQMRIPSNPYNYTFNVESRNNSNHDVELKKPVCNIINNKVFITCDNSGVEWWNNNIVQCAEYAIKNLGNADCNNQTSLPGLPD